MQSTQYDSQELKNKRLALAKILKKTENIEGVREGTVGDYDAHHAEIKIYVKTGADIPKISREARKILADAGISILNNWSPPRKRKNGYSKDWFSAEIPYSRIKR